MQARAQGREQLKKALPRLPWALGYSLMSAWATVLLFSSLFSSAPSSSIVTLSMLSGMVACVATFFLRSGDALFNGRGGVSSLYATCLAAGTLLCTLPALAGDALIHDAGLVLSGFFAILLLLTWFDAFSRLPSRTVVFLGGCSFLMSAAVVFAILALPLEAASVVTSALPLVSLSLLPRPAPAREAAPNGRATLGAVLTQAVSWKTLLGIALSFFVIGTMGTLAPELGVSVNLSPAYLGIPAGLTILFVLSAWLSPARLDASILFKLLLVAVAGIAFLLVYAGSTNLSLVFFLYITADVLLWSVLALAAKKTPVPAHAVFACGWLAECVGNILGHNVAAAMGNTSTLFAVVMLLIIVAVGFAFGDGLFMVELEEREGAGGKGALAGAGEGTGAQADEACASLADNSGVHAGQCKANAGTQAEPREKAHDSSWASKIGARLTGGKPQPAAAEPCSTADGAAQTTTDPDPAPERDAQAAAMDAFAARHGLSEREADVFRLWVTGHGLKHIQNTLFISESTVKTHLRSIYRKCDTHNRAEILELFERER